MKMINKILQLSLVVALFCSCSNNNLKFESSQVEGVMGDYLELISEDFKIERKQDGKWVQYEVKLLMKVKESYECEPCVTGKKSKINPDKTVFQLTFYDSEDRPLSINSETELKFSTFINTCVGSDICDFLAKPVNTEDWFIFRSINLKEESDYFDSYPMEDIAYAKLTSK